MSCHFFIVFVSIEISGLWFLLLCILLRTACDWQLGFSFNCQRFAWLTLLLCDSSDFSFQSFLLLGQRHLFSHFFFLCPALSNISLQTLNIDLPIIVMRLVFAHIVAVMPSELFKYLFLLMSPHFLLVIPLLDLLMNLSLDLVLHVLRHFALLFEFAHAV